MFFCEITSLSYYNSSGITNSVLQFVRRTRLVSRAASHHRFPNTFVCVFRTIQNARMFSSVNRSPNCIEKSTSKTVSLLPPSFAKIQTPNNKLLARFGLSGQWLKQASGYSSLLSPIVPAFSRVNVNIETFFLFVS